MAVRPRMPNSFSDGTVMPIDSKLVGDWVASAYLPDGRRIEHKLYLREDGTFDWMSIGPDGQEHKSHGSWRHDYSSRIVTFDPDQKKPDERPSRWRVLQIEELGASSSFMVLRWVALASRNLPVMFYRDWCDPKAQYDAARDARGAS